LASDLCKWANEFQINQVALTSLLQVLSRLFLCFTYFNYHFSWLIWSLSTLWGITRH